MRKIHLRANKLTGSNLAKSFCASRVVGDKVIHNSRTTYRFMASEIVGFKTFKEVAPEKRCAHCVDFGLIARNKIRKQKGFTQVKCIDDAFIEHE